MPALGQAYWRGFLRLQLVSINVNVYTATESKSEITFNQIHKPSGQRVRYQKVVPGIGKIDETDIVMGYQVEPNVHITLEPEEAKAIRLEGADRKQRFPPEVKPARANVVNIMDALKKSLKAEALPTGGKAKSARKKAG